MGLDFIHQKKRAFRKMFDGGREALASPDLLPSEEDWEDQQVLFEVPRDCSLVDGDDLVVQISGSRLVALRGQDVGVLNPGLRHTLDLIRTRGQLTLTDLRESSQHTQPTTWSNRIASLIKQGFVVPVQEPNKRVYRFVLPEAGGASGS